MKIRDIINTLQELAPTKYAEDFDNVGLLVGNEKNEVTGILVTLDTIEEVVEEAIEKECNLIVSFHPIIFKGLKKLNGKNYVERTVLKAIKNDIAIYAIHTALDNSLIGVNDIICNKLNLINKTILIPKSDTIKKLITYAPIENSAKIKRALFDAGAGSLGNYDDCSFTTKGIGSYKGNEQSNPAIGAKNEYHEEKEHMIAVTYLSHLENQVITALHKAHPYEEIAHEIHTIDNKNQNIGMGMIGELNNEMSAEEFLSNVKSTMKCKMIRHSKIVKDKIKKVAVLGGSGSFAIDAAKKSGADILLTADLKYHDFFSAENEIILADIGHYESEQFTKSFLTDYLSEKITNFAPALLRGKVILSTTNTNPVKYL